MSMTWVALGSAGESNTLTMPPFSPTNTLPPGAKAMAVGRFSPLHTALSENPVGTAAVTAGDVGAAERVAGPRTSPPRPPAADAGPAASREARRTTSEPAENAFRAPLRARLDRASCAITQNPSPKSSGEWQHPTVSAPKASLCAMVHSAHRPPERAHCVFALRRGIQ